LLTDSQFICYTSHHQWNLLDPVDFMKCYSFLRNLAGATATLKHDLEGMDGKTIARSVVSASWRALTPPTSAAGLKKRKRKRSDIEWRHGGGAYRPPVKGANSDGIDDLEPEESREWHESVKHWQLERQRPDVEPSKFGFPLKRHLVDLQPMVVYDGEHGLRSVVDEWSANVL
jgi:hypothetical protein